MGKDTTQNLWQAWEGHTVTPGILEKGRVIISREVYVTEVWRLARFSALVEIEHCPTG